MATELLQYADNTEQVSRSFVRSGIKGNFDVVRAMIEKIRQSVNYDRGFEKFTKDLLLQANMDSYTTPETILNLIFNYITSQVKYIADIAGNVESIKSPFRTLSDKFGDCDDLTILTCSMLGVLGFEDTRIVLTKYGNEKSYSHVYTVCYVNGKRFVLDASLQNPKLNKEIPYAQIKEIPVFNYVEGVDNVYGKLYSFLESLKNLGHKTLETVPSVAGVLPFGTFGGAVLQAGANMITNANERERSFNETASKIIKALDKIIIQLMNEQIAFDVAKSEAVAISSQLSLVKAENEQVYKSVTKRIKEKLDFINNFDAYAKEHNIKITNINNKMMLAFGLGIISFSAYKAYQYYYQG